MGIGMLKKIAILSAFLGLAATRAFAGYHSEYPVWVNTSMGWALGSMSSAAAAANTVEYIGCSLWSQEYLGTTTIQASCIARNGAGVTLSCRTQAEPMTRAVASITPYSHIEFQVDSGGICTVIRVTTSSYYNPR